MAPTSVSITMTINSLKFQEIKLFPVRSYQNAAKSVHFFSIQQNSRLIFSCNPHTKRLQHALRPTPAVDSGLEVSITDPGDLITVKDAKIVVESRVEDKIQVRVDLTGDGTQKIFDRVLINLARSAPPIPGFRREKGGSEGLLLQILGEERVTKFVVEEIVSSTMTDYSKKESLNVKEKKVTTTQTPEELRKLFNPGNKFGFNAVLKLEKPEVEEPETEESSSSSYVESEDISV